MITNESETDRLYVWQRGFLEDRDRQFAKTRKYRTAHVQVKQGRDPVTFSWQIGPYVYVDDDRHLLNATVDGISFCEMFPFYEERSIEIPTHLHSFQK